MLENYLQIYFVDLVDSLWTMRGACIVHAGSRIKPRILVFVDYVD